MMGRQERTRDNTEPLQHEHVISLLRDVSSEELVQADVDTSALLHLIPCNNDVVLTSSDELWLSSKTAEYREQGMPRKEARQKATDNAYAIALGRQVAKSRQAVRRAIQEELAERVAYSGSMSAEESGRLRNALTGYGIDDPDRALGLCERILEAHHGSYDSSPRAAQRRIEAFAAVGRGTTSRNSPTNPHIEELTEEKDRLVVAKLEKDLNSAGRFTERGIAEVCARKKAEYEPLFEALNKSYPEVITNKKVTPIGRGVEVTGRAAEKAIRVDRAAMSAVKSVGDRVDGRAVGKAAAVTTVAAFTIAGLPSVAAASSTQHESSKSSVGQSAQQPPSSTPTVKAGHTNLEPLLENKRAATTKSASRADEFIIRVPQLDLSSTAERAVQAASHGRPLVDIAVAQRPNITHAVSIESAASPEAVSNPRNREMVDKVTQIIIDKGGSKAVCGQVIRFAVNELGATYAQAAAAVGNAMQESECKPGAIQKPGGGRGLFQWDGGRREALFKFAAQRKVDWKDLDVQLEFWKYEAENTEKRAINAWRNSHGLIEATDVFLKLYERAGKPHMDRRHRFALEAESDINEAIRIIQGTLAASPQPVAPPPVAPESRHDPGIRLASLDALLGERFADEVQVASAGPSIASPGNSGAQRPDSLPDAVQAVPSPRTAPPAEQAVQAGATVPAPVETPANNKNSASKGSKPGVTGAVIEFGEREDITILDLPVWTPPSTPPPPSEAGRFSPEHLTNGLYLKNEIMKRYVGYNPWTKENGVPVSGRLDKSELRSIGLDHHMLYPDAAAAFIAMNEAYKAEHNGKNIPVGDSYRPYNLQEKARNEKPKLAAIPGNSNHGWGFALDIEMGAQRYKSPLYIWIIENGPQYGWYNPIWAQSSGSKPEPWHFEWFGSAGQK
jgi:hypothetical protein